VAAARLLTDSLWLIEVNTPVYLLATSGRFDLSSEAHREILCGELRPPETITYPGTLCCSPSSSGARGWSSCPSEL